MKKDYIHFLEKHLGKIQHGWDSDQGNYQIARFNHVPHDGAVTFTTVGLNRCVQLDETAKIKLSQELVFISDESFGEQNIPSIMMQIAEMIIDSGNILLQGELIGPYGKMFEGTLMEAVYVTSPVYFEEAFFVCVDEPGLEIIMAWLIPVTAEEAAFIQQYGGEAFEDLLVREDPDLTDLGRTSLV